MNLAEKFQACSALLAGAGLLLFASSVQAQDKPEFTLEPSGDWKLVRYGDRCSLVRSFGEGESATALRIEQGTAKPYYTVSIAGRPVRHPYGSVMSIQFGPDELPSERGYVINETRNGDPAIVMYGVLLAPVTAEQAEKGTAGMIGPEREAAIDRLVLSRAVIDPFALSLGTMTEPLQRLSTCALAVADKLYSASRSSGGKSRPAEPQNNPGGWIRSADYPRDLVRKGMEGTVAFRLTVDKQGVATNCHIEATNRPQMFDDTVCLALLRRAKFHPAMDAEGKPQASYYVNRVHFQMP